MLVSAIVGEDARSTVDIDTTVRNLPLTEPEIRKIIENIISIPTDDSLTFEIADTREIMEEHDYAGVRIKMIAHLEKLRRRERKDDMDRWCGGRPSEAEANRPAKMV